MVISVWWGMGIIIIQKKDMYDLIAKRQQIHQRMRFSLLSSVCVSLSLAASKVDSAANQTDINRRRKIEIRRERRVREGERSSIYGGFGRREAAEKNLDRFQGTGGRREFAESGRARGTILSRLLSSFASLWLPRDSLQVRGDGLCCQGMVIVVIDS